MQVQLNVSFSWTIIWYLDHFHGRRIEVHIDGSVHARAAALARVVRRGITAVVDRYAVGTIPQSILVEWRLVRTKIL